MLLICSEIVTKQNTIFFTSMPQIQRSRRLTQTLKNITSTRKIKFSKGFSKPCYNTNWCWCGPPQKHQQGPITCSKWSNDSVQDKGIECIGFECFNQARIERSIRVSRGDLGTSYPCARGVQHNLIWAMRWEQQRKQKNPSTTWKQHGWLPFPFVSRIKGLHGRL